MTVLKYVDNIVQNDASIVNDIMDDSSFNSHDSKINNE